MFYPDPSNLVELSSELIMAIIKTSLMIPIQATGNVIMKATSPSLPIPANYKHTDP